MICAMDALGRQAALVDLLQRDGRVEVSAAAERFGTAEMTVRRDLDVLVARGIARRVRGGAVSLLMRGEEMPFSMRAVDAADEKRRIGLATAELIQDGESVLLDSGTTALEVARALKGRRLTVMPLSLHAAMVLSGQDSVRLLMPGGETRPGELALVGPLALAGINAVRFDTAVLSCCGLADGQVTAHDLGDAAAKQAMLSAAARVILVADASKFGRTAMAAVCGTERIDVVITGTGAPGETISAMASRGVEVHRA